MNKVAYYKEEIYKMAGENREDTILPSKFSNKLGNSIGMYGGFFAGSGKSPKTRIISGGVGLTGASLPWAVAKLKLNKKEEEIKENYRETYPELSEEEIESIYQDSLESEAIDENRRLLNKRMIQNSTGSVIGGLLAKKVQDKIMNKTLSNFSVEREI